MVNYAINPMRKNNLERLIDEMGQTRLSIYGLRAIGEGSTLTYKEAREFASIVLGLAENTRSAQLGILLGGLMASTPTVETVAGVIDAIFDYEEYNPLDNETYLSGVVGVAGSGKKSWKTANITTAATLVAATGGARIAKAVSGATSSVCGSADMFRMLGCTLSQDIDVILEQLEETGLGIFEIEHLIPRFDSIYGGLFHAPHLLSLGFPALLIPLRVDSFCYGLAHPATTLSRCVIERYRPGNVVTVACHVSECRWIDELTTIGVNQISRSSSVPHPATISKTLSELFERRQTKNFDEEALRQIAGASTPRDQLELMLAILQGVAHPELLYTVALNAGLLLEMATGCTFIEGFNLAMSILHDGASMATLDRYIKFGSISKK